MRIPQHLFFLIILVVAFSGKLRAQTWEVGGSIGESGYIGDLNPLKLTDVGAGGFVKRNFNNYLSLRANYAYATIQGNDNTSSNPQLNNRNLSFSTSLSEISLIAEFNFMNYIPEIGRNKYTPFIFAGFGSVAYNPTAIYKGVNYDLRPLMTEGQAKPYSDRAYVIPYGAGIKFNFTGKWNLIVDLGYRNTNTGYLDDVYGAYADKAKMTSIVAQALSDRSGETTGAYIGSPGSQRGNYNHDSYMILGFTISYTFLTQNCYRFN
jgi:hypothetical protein